MRTVMTASAKQAEAAARLLGPVAAVAVTSDVPARRLDRVAARRFAHRRRDPRTEAGRSLDAIPMLAEPADRPVEALGERRGGVVAERAARLLDARAQPGLRIPF